MYNYETLEKKDIEVLHETFINAFSDYQVKIDLPLWKLKQMLKRRGFCPEISIGAFKDELMVGFILNGFRNWNGLSTAYDTGTGVIPEYRKQGITSSMIKYIKEMLKEKKVDNYLLEVIKTNKSAFDLYRKYGFEITRSFSCFKMEKSEFICKEMKNFTIEHPDTIDSSLWEQLESFWDVKPSWQNSIDSIKAISDEFVYTIVKVNDSIAGYGIVEKKTGDIPQLAVNKLYRRQGIANCIIADLLNKTEPNKVSILNIESDAEGIITFIKKVGFENYVDQYEMMLKI